MNIILTINKADVFSEVVKTTAYEGAKNAAFDQAYIKDDDRIALSRFWTESIDSIAKLAKDYFKTSVTSEGSYVITLDMPDNFNDGLADNMNTLAFSFCVNYIAGKWFEITVPAKVEPYSGSAVKALQELNSLLCQRKRPERLED